MQILCWACRSKRVPVRPVLPFVGGCALNERNQMRAQRRAGRSGMDYSTLSDDLLAMMRMVLERNKITPSNHDAVQGSSTRNGSMGNVYPKALDRNREFREKLQQVMQSNQRAGTIVSVCMEFYGTETLEPHQIEETLQMIEFHRLYHSDEQCLASRELFDYALEHCFKASIVGKDQRLFQLLARSDTTGTLFKTSLLPNRTLEINTREASFYRLSGLRMLNIYVKRAQYLLSKTNHPLSSSTHRNIEHRGRVQELPFTAIDSAEVTALERSIIEFRETLVKKGVFETSASTTTLKPHDVLANAIQVFHSWGNYEEVVKTFETLSRNLNKIYHITSNWNPKVYGPVVSAYGHQDKFDQAERLFRAVESSLLRWKTPNEVFNQDEKHLVTLFSHYIDALTRCKKHEQALKELTSPSTKLYRTRHIEPYKAFFRAVVQGQVEFSAAITVYFHLLKSRTNVKMDSECQLLLLKAAIKEKYRSFATELFNAMPSKNFLEDDEIADFLDMLNSRPRSSDLRMIALLIARRLTLPKTEFAVKEDVHQEFTYEWAPGQNAITNRKLLDQIELVIARFLESEDVENCGYILKCIDKQSRWRLLRTHGSAIVRARKFNPMKRLELWLSASEQSIYEALNVETGIEIVTFCIERLAQNGYTSCYHNVLDTKIPGQLKATGVQQSLVMASQALHVSFDILLLIMERKSNSLENQDYDLIWAQTQDKIHVLLETMARLYKQLSFHDFKRPTSSFSSFKPTHSPIQRPQHLTMRMITKVFEKGFKVYVENGKKDLAQEWIQAVSSDFPDLADPISNYQSRLNFGSESDVASRNRTRAIRMREIIDACRKHDMELTTKLIQKSIQEKIPISIKASCTFLELCGRSTAGDFGLAQVIFDKCRDNPYVSNAEIDDLFHGFINAALNRGFVDLAMKALDEVWMLRGSQFAPCEKLYTNLLSVQPQHAFTLDKLRTVHKRLRKVRHKQNGVFSGSQKRAYASLLRACESTTEDGILDFVESVYAELVEKESCSAEMMMSMVKASLRHNNLARAEQLMEERLVKFAHDPENIEDYDIMINYYVNAEKPLLTKAKKFFDFAIMNRGLKPSVNTLMAMMKWAMLSGDGDLKKEMFSEVTKTMSLKIGNVDHGSCRRVVDSQTLKSVIDLLLERGSDPLESQNHCVGDFSGRQQRREPTTKSHKANVLMAGELTHVSLLQDTPWHYGNINNVVKALCSIGEINDAGKIYTNAIRKFFDTQKKAVAPFTQAGNSLIRSYLGQGNFAAASEVFLSMKPPRSNSDVADRQIQEGASVQANDESYRLMVKYLHKKEDKNNVVRLLDEMKVQFGQEELNRAIRDNKINYYKR